VRAAAAVAFVVLAGCGGGADKPSSGPPAAPPTMRLTSPAFHDGGTIPTRFTCSGDGISPPLSIAGAPERTRELALVVEDRDAGNFVHWIVLGIPKGAVGVRAGAGPRGLVQTKNSFGKRGWGAPCPPKGDKPHRYVFSIYALDRPIGLDEDASPDEVHEALGAPAIARGTLVGRFSR
jgi:Raf kinase inhibitor-like YbhB/YbcL family protein